MKITGFGSRIVTEKELHQYQEKYKDKKDILNLISYVKNLQNQIKNMFETMSFLEEDVDRLKGDKLQVTSNIKIKIIEKTDKLSYKEIANMMDFFHIDSKKQQYIEIEDTPFILYPKKIELVTRTSKHDVMKITFNVGHECPHDKAYFVEDDEIFIFKEVLNRSSNK